MDRRFDSIEKRFDGMESWLRWIIGFGVGTVGLSMVTMICKALYYDKQVKPDILSSVEKAVATAKLEILLAVKDGAGAEKA
ncbi:hypothetical protein BGX38DRAFT_1210031 [Terfezia claveryi]|nr:hypothetical protein BGX38DRAFT_1210031 [Terfezia claveryi]